MSTIQFVERVSEARQQAAETIKRRREERGDDYCERQRSSSQRGRGVSNEWNLVLYDMLCDMLYVIVSYGMLYITI